MKKLENCTLRGAYLSFVENGNYMTIRIPQGLIQKSADIIFYKDDNKIFAKLKDETCQINPSPKWTISAGGMNFTVKLALSLKELKAAKKLLLDHYMGIPSRGLFINVYHESSKDPIACGCLDRLYYSMTLGRKDIFDVAGREDLLNQVFKKKTSVSTQEKRIPDTTISVNPQSEKMTKGDRAKVVNELRIAWISRIAIVDNEYDDTEKKFRGIGLSVKLAELMGQVAHECMLPHADFVEVFMSCPAKEANFRKDHNLFLHAHYQLSTEKIRSSKMVFWDYENEGYISATKFYLYKDLREKTMKRLFIPLYSDPFKWFETGEKEWELRKRSKRFNPNNFAIGSYVELRRGYVAKNGVCWGRIVDYKEFSSIRDVFLSIPYQKIINADNLEQATNYVCSILNTSLDSQEDLIAIKIKKITILNDIIFNDRYMPMLISGKKTTTVRAGIRDYPPGYYNAFNDNKSKCILIRVVKTEITKFGLLDDSLASTDGYDSIDQLKEELLQFYPDLIDDSPMTTVVFEVV